MNTDSIVGRRLPDTDIFPENMKKGDYVKYKDLWWFILPNGDLCNIHTWTVVENEDKTITITHPITSLSVDGWHGYLIDGEFRSSSWRDNA